jgi:putative Mn2+ efflux pump MntP
VGCGRRLLALTAAPTLKLIALVLPLGLDTLGVALALGFAGLPQEHRRRVSLLFAGFEAAMPLIGVALGAPLGRAIGSVADYAAAALLIALGAYMFITENDEQDRLLSLTQGGLFGALALGVSISLDELAIGFSAGLLQLPIATLVIAVAVQAFAFTQVGLRVGERGRDSLRELTEQLAGIALVGLGVILLVERLT